MKYGDIFFKNEQQFTEFNFKKANISLLMRDFDVYEKEAKNLIEVGLIFPGYDYIIKCSHFFNLLDARGAISVTERAIYIKRIRTLAKMCAQKYLENKD